jgi:nitrate/nitrite transporter NarK
MTYVAPYLQYIYGASENLATAANIFQRTVMMFAGGALGGFIADKIGSRSKVMLWSFVLLIVTAFVFVVVSPASFPFAAAIITIMFMAYAVYSLRGLYFSLTGELKMPIALTGTIVGLASFIGYLPDIFVYPLFGNFLDTYEGNQGYVYMYALLCGLAVIGLFIILLVRRTVKKAQPEENAE